MNDTAAILSREAPVARRSSQPVDLVLIGARGQVGSAFRRHLARQADALRGEVADLRLLAAFDTRGFSLDECGLDPMHIDDYMPARKSGDCERLLDKLCHRPHGRSIVIDCTASEDVADFYPRLLGAGIGLVAANKRANARGLRFYLELQRLSRVHRAPYRYETTVGAAIPLLGPLRELRLRGERVESIQGVLSGSLSYVLNRMHQGCPFSHAVDEARRLGFTEPNPFDDLRAVDLGRKLLVLAREAGFMLEPDDIHVGPLTHATDCEPGKLIEHLCGEDSAWAARVGEAMARDERLVAMAEADRGGARIALRSLPAASTLAQLLPGQNHIVIYTSLQERVPLSVGGPGAGVEITAAGVLSDVIGVAAQWES